MPRLHDHVWSYPSAGAARPYSLPRGMIAAALCPQGPGAPEPEPAPRGQREGTAGFSARPGSWHHDLVQRSLVLFSFGVVLALVLNLLQIQRNVTLFPDEVIATIFSSAWWVPPCCGTAAAGQNKRSGTSWPSGLETREKNSTALTPARFSPQCSSTSNWKGPLSTLVQRVKVLRPKVVQSFSDAETKGRDPSFLCPFPVLPSGSHLGSEMSLLNQGPQLPASQEKERHRQCPAWKFCSFSATDRWVAERRNTGRNKLSSNKRVSPTARRPGCLGSDSSEDPVCCSFPGI